MPFGLAVAGVGGRDYIPRSSADGPEQLELTEQLQGRSGPRQVEGARIALAHNGGGNIGTDAAAMCVTILRA